MAGVSRVCWPAWGGLSPGLEEFMPRGREGASERSRRAVTRLSQTSLCIALCKAARVCTHTHTHDHFKSLWFQKTSAGYGCLTPDSGTDQVGKGQSLLHIPSSNVQHWCSTHPGFQQVHQIHSGLRFSTQRWLSSGFLSTAVPLCHTECEYTITSPINSRLRIRPDCLSEKCNYGVKWLFDGAPLTPWASLHIVKSH